MTPVWKMKRSTPTTVLAPRVLVDAPVNRISSTPVPPSTRSSTVSPLPTTMTSLPVPPETLSLPPAARSRKSAPVPPVSVSAPAPPLRNSEPLLKVMLTMLAFRLA